MEDTQIKQMLDGISSLEKRLADMESLSKETHNKLLEAVKDAKPVSQLGIPEEACSKFLKVTRALLEGDVAGAKAVSGADNATGGYLIPTEVADTIISITPNYGVVRKYATIWTMGQRSVNVPKAISNLYDYVVDEGASLTPAVSGNLFGQIPLSAKRHGSLVPITSDMIDFASVNVVDFLVEQISRAISKGTDSIAFLGKTSAGTAVSSMPGIFADADATAVPTSGTTFSTLSATNMDGCISALDGDLLDGARFYMNSKVLFGFVAGLKDNDGRLIYQPATGTNPAMWRGFPIEITNVLPGTSEIDTKFICFGNLKYLFLGQAKGVMMDTAREATIIEGNTTYNLWQQGMKAIKVEEMIDIKVAFGKAFSYIKTAAS